MLNEPSNAQNWLELLTLKRKNTWSEKIRNQFSGSIFTFPEYKTELHYTLFHLSNFCLIGFRCIYWCNEMCSTKKKLMHI